jgi:hypothetical protein
MPDGTLKHPSGAKAQCFCGFHGTAEAVPFQNKGWKSKQRVETLQLKPCPFKTRAGEVNSVLKLYS